MFDLKLLNIELNCIKAMRKTRNFDESSSKVLNVIGKSFNCKFCIYWKWESGSSIKRCAVWPSGCELVNSICDNDLNVLKVCELKKPIVTSKDIYFALKSNGTVYGVLQLHLPQLVNVTTDSLLAIEGLGNSLGKKINIH